MVRHKSIIDTSVEISVCYTLVQERSARMCTPFQKGPQMVALVWLFVCRYIANTKIFKIAQVKKI